MTKISPAIICCLFLFGCRTLRTATERAEVRTVEIHDTIVDVREVLRIDSVDVYRGHSVVTANDTVYVSDTIRELRWVAMYLNDSTDRSSRQSVLDSLKSTEQTVSVESGGCSTWNGWNVFTTVWFALSLLFTIVILVLKIWKHLKK